MFLPYQKCNMYYKLSMWSLLSSVPPSRHKRVHAVQLLSFPVCSPPTPLVWWLYFPDLETLPPPLSIYSLLVCVPSLLISRWFLCHVITCQMLSYVCYYLNLLQMAETQSYTSSYSSFLCLG